MPFHAVTFIGEDGPLSGFGGSGKAGSEVIAERARKWPAGLSVVVNPR